MPTCNPNFIGLMVISCDDHPYHIYIYISKFLILHIKLFSWEHLTKENVTFGGKFLHGGKKRKENTYRGANTILPSKPIIGHHLKVSMEKKGAKNILGRY